MAVLAGINLPPDCPKGSHRLLDPYCCLEWVLGTTVYQITATAVIATLSQFQWPLRVSAVKITMATAQRIHCAVLLFITTSDSLVVVRCQRCTLCSASHQDVRANCAVPEGTRIHSPLSQH